MAENYEESKLYRLRHSAAHVMAQAVLEKFPEGKVAIGPPIDDGFYYDFDLPRPLTPEDLEEIEARMREIIKNNSDFVREEVSAEEAREIFADQPYKLELIDGLEQGDVDEHGNPVDEKPVISIYKSDAFVDLCRGPHLESTGKIHPAAIKLMNVAGAYWRGDEHNPMLQRIYGTAWLSPKDLKDYLWRLEEAKKRDHRKLGRELDLYNASGMGGPGFVYWLPNGTIVKENLEQLWKDAHREAGYQLVSTPHIAPVELWQTSGHYDYYRDNMYFTEVENGEYALKPMNCPGHIIIYGSRKRSYRELPLRLAELGTVYRYERSGALHGLMRVRGFTVDDGHIFCTPDQIVSEIQDVVRFALYFLKIFDFGYRIELSLMDPDDTAKYAGDPEDWARVEPALARALDEMGEEYVTVKGEAAFYGPKIDIKLRDALGRYWQGPTVQFDFNIPGRFDLNYVGEDGGEHRVYMVHRALFGSVERFIGNLIEHFAGNFPGWLSPVQLVILPITSAQADFAGEVYRKARSAGLRCRLDARSETIGYRIREAETGKVPFMFVVGQRETESGMVAVRRHGEGDLGSMDADTAVQRVAGDCRRPALPDRR